MSRQLFEQALAAEGVTGKLAELAFSIYTQESGAGRNTKTSNRGAVGGMQVMPGTFGDMADKGWDINNPEHNARAGIRYLKMLDKRSGGDPALTAAGYYGGPGGLEKARRGVAVSDPKNPNAPTTLEYGQQVAARLRGNPAPVMAQVPSQRPPVEAPMAPAMLAQAQNTPGAASTRGRSGAPLPPELLSYLESRGKPRVAVAPAAANAWQSFLSSMQRPQGGAVVARVPVQQAEDIDYGGALAIPAFNTQPVAHRKVDFSPFAAFGGWGRTA